MERPCPSSAMPVTPDSGVGVPPYMTSSAPRSPRSPNLQRRDCRMHDGLPPHPYYVDPDTGMSYWEPLSPEVSTPSAAAATGQGAGAASEGPVVAQPSSAKAWTVAKPSAAGVWSPRGVVAAQGGVISMPLLAPTVANAGGGGESGSQQKTEQATGNPGDE